jgi:hypothetical protein
MRTNSITFHLASLSLLLCLSIWLQVATAFGQTETENAKKLSTVAAPLRGRLVERLNLYFEYDRTNQYEKKYDLFSEAYLSVSWKSKSDYVNFKRERESQGLGETLIEFKITSIEYYSLNDSDYPSIHIKGTSKFRRGNKVKKKKGRFIDARFQNGDWYFSEWLDEILITD